MITQEFTARLKRVNAQDVDLPVPVTLSYDWANDPFAVQAIFKVSQDQETVWHFSRELLRVGARSLTPYGYGDVKFRWFPSHGIVLMCLRTNVSQAQAEDTASHADVALPWDEVGVFLEATAEQAQQQDCGALVDDFLKELFEA